MAHLTPDLVGRTCHLCSTIYVLLLVTMIQRYDYLFYNISICISEVAWRYDIRDFPSTVCVSLLQHLLKGMLEIRCSAYDIPTYAPIGIPTL